ncbi:MAG: phosphoglycolate phosphatase [Halobacteriales archaeon]
MTHYDAVLFDQDGVLVEPPAADVQAAATRAAFRDVGVANPSENHVDAVVNGLTVDRLYEICRAYDLDPEAFWAARERLDERSQFERFEADARTTYDDLEATGALDVPRGVVSNNHDSTVAFVLEYFDLRPLFDAAYGREKTIESLRLKKPNPHYLDLGLDALDADDALYVGDGESDVLAAHRAGVDSALLRRSHNADLDPDPAPNYVVDTLHEVATIVDEAGRSGE